MKCVFIRRREFIAAFAGAVAIWTLAAPVQGSGKIYRVGVLFPADEHPGGRIIKEVLAKHGFVEGHNITYDFRATKGQAEQFPVLARELVARRPDVIVSASAPAVQALLAETRKIPIVLAGVSGPIARGVTKSIARPTGNVTGFTTGFDTVAAKRLQLLLEVVPSARKVALLWVATNAQNRHHFELVRQTAADLKIEFLSLPVTNDTDISPAIAKAEAEGAAALLIAGEAMTVRNRQTIIDECLLRNIPAMHNYAFEVRDGALMSYGSKVGEDYTRAADYVARILKGAKVADLPFQEPVKFELVVNLQTAKALGLDFPPSILVRATEVIE